MCSFSQTVLFQVLGLGNTVFCNRTFQLTRISSHLHRSFVNNYHTHRMTMKSRTSTLKTKQERRDTCVIYVNLRSVNVLGIIQTMQITYFNCLIVVNFIIVSQVCRVTLWTQYRRGNQNTQISAPELSLTSVMNWVQEGREQC